MLASKRTPLLLRNIPLSLLRRFSGAIDIKDEDFLPQIDLIKEDLARKAFRESSTALESQLTFQGEDLRQIQEIEGELYKYGLPLENKEILIGAKSRALVEAQKTEAPTATQNIFSRLELNQNSSYEGFVLRNSQAFNHEIDMYGSVRKAGMAERRGLAFGVPIPFETVRNETQMQQFRNYFVFNRDIPGAMENVHPNKFIANLRPVQEFRHTPVIPISDKDIREYQQKIEERNRKGYYVEVKKDTLYYYGIVVLVLCCVVYMFLIVNEKEMRVKYNMDRSRYRKHGSLKYMQQMSGTHR